MTRSGSSTRPEEAPIRLLFFLNAPGVPGGVEEHVAGLALRLPPDRFDVTVVCPASVRAFFAPLARDGRRVVALDLYRPRHLAAMRRLIGLLRAHSIDIVHSHQFTATMYAAPLARLAGVPAVVETPHLREAWRRGWLKRSYLIDRLVYTAVDRFVAVSRANQLHLTETKGCRANRVVQIHNGRDLSAFRPDPDGRASRRASLGVRDDELLIVHIGRLAEQKGHRYLLDAYAHVRTRVPGARMVFVGDGELRADLERCVRERGWTREVTFTGYRTEVRDFLAAADIVVLPSLFEGLPLAAVEAGAMGRPMVATDVDGTPEVVLHGVTGLLVPPADPGRLADALVELAIDAARRERLGAAAREFVLGRFGVEQHVARHVDLYTRLAKRHRAARVSPGAGGLR
jgi:glycosyltransferase involved in cell wall biosynthesis